MTTYTRQTPTNFEGQAIDILLMDNRHHDHPDHEEKKIRRTTSSTSTATTRTESSTSSSSATLSLSPTTTTKTIRTSDDDREYYRRPAGNSFHFHHPIHNKNPSRNTMTQRQQQKQVPLRYYMQRSRGWIRLYVPPPPLTEEEREEEEDDDNNNHNDDDERIVDRKKNDDGDHDDDLSLSSSYWARRKSLYSVVTTTTTATDVVGHSDWSLLWDHKDNDDETLVSVDDCFWYSRRRFFNRIDRRSGDYDCSSYDDIHPDKMRMSLSSSSSSSSSPSSSLTVGTSSTCSSWNVCLEYQHTDKDHEIDSYRRHRLQYHDDDSHVQPNDEVVSSLPSPSVPSLGVLHPLLIRWTKEQEEEEEDHDFDTSSFHRLWEEKE